MGFEAEGKFVYDPVAGKAKNAWWVIVECPKDILDYYHYWVKAETGIVLQKPLFGSHISLVRGEEPPEECKSLWREHHEEVVRFTYSNDVENLNGFWWLPVKSDELSKVRMELGLTPEPEFGYHLTIGREIT